MAKSKLKVNRRTKKNKKLSSPRLIFLPIKSSDADRNYLEWINNPEITKFMGVVRKYNLKSLTNYINHEKKKSFFWILIDKKSKKKIGTIKLSNFSLTTCYIGSLIGDKNFWNLGYATEAKYYVLKFAFDYLKMNKVISGVFLKNKANHKVNKKIGFKKEGLFKEYIYKNMEFHDVVFYSILKKNFKKKKV